MFFFTASYKDKRRRKYHKVRNFETADKTCIFSIFQTDIVLRHCSCVSAYRKSLLRFEGPSQTK